MTYAQMIRNLSPKIAIFLSTSGHSGVDRAMAKMIPELCRRGFRIDLLQVKNHGPYINDEIDNLRLVPLGRSHTMSCFGPVISYLKREKPDVLFSDKDKANRVSLLAARVAKSAARIVVRSGTIMSINLKNRSFIEVLFHKLSMQYLYPDAHAVIVPSIYARDDLARLCPLTPEQIDVVPFPVVDETLLAMSKELPSHPWLIKKTCPVIVAVGELSPRKDHATLIRAFAELRSSRPCKLLIIGRGGLKTSLLQMIAKLGLESDIHLLGFLPNPYPYIANADLLVHTATFEGLGMVLVESLYLQTPVIATDCQGGPREILADGKYGKLVPVADPRKLAEAINDEFSRVNGNTAGCFTNAIAPYTLASSVDGYLRSMGLPVTAEAAHFE